jgi:hypothetical protein
MITQDRLKELLDYNEITGVFTNKVDRVKARAGNVAGGICHGYWYIRLDMVRYAAHRLAWLFVYGVWPIDCIDHIDRNKINNAIRNLRLATHTQNNYNREYDSKHYRGVGISGSKYTASIKYHSSNLYLGTYDTPEEASFIYESKAREIQGEFYNDPGYSYIIDKPPVRRVQSNRWFTGVSKSGNRFRAKIKINGTNVSLGTFDTAEEAYKVFLSKKKERDGNGH